MTTTTIDPTALYTRSEAERLGVSPGALRGLRRHERDGQLLFSGEDLAAALTFAEEERRVEETQRANTGSQADPYGLGPPTR